MGKKKAKDLGIDPNYTIPQDLLDMGINLNEVPPRSGLMNTPNAPIAWGYQRPEGSWMVNNQGAYITAGTIPPTGLASGAGAYGVLSPTIDLVVGRNAGARQGSGPEKDSVVDNNFGTDAARIYISRLTDIERYFGLARRPGDYRGDRSGIGVKADRVAIIGREGVKIVTGKMQGGTFGPYGETNSLGGRIIAPAPKIELIAGNNYDKVQGVALGEATRDALRGLHNIVQDLSSAVYNFITLQTGFDAIVGVSPLPHYPAGAAPKAMGNINMVMSSMYATRANLMTWQFNHLNPAGRQYIVSRNVRSN
jgi:hypothetical protein|tara:strand:- start:7162 stop:8085 length:924 start_codon:yes stop_codon:yes gene_type:complete